ncbi:Late secretory pathway protein AVL9 [Penicillium paradoxum]|uniref:Late secretory pathway protein AVL9 n=1 Tax=Penicillium paradoxum TaxID=176176 RepID=UPI0025474DAE|nr:Late secretory pathway protein AVL9 [Penicillium paradoxum]KAJ5793840.1 Late secretory pathway protein AVL9 [Penicillium paradoxum]
MATQHKQDPIVLVIDFHHARGPEIEHCIADDGTDPAIENDWSLLPFMALSDGAHLYDTLFFEKYLPAPLAQFRNKRNYSVPDQLTPQFCRSTEEFSYFTLRRIDTPNTPGTSLFGIACSRQLDSSLLINRSPEVTRSTVQKAVVVVTDTPQRVGQLREKLSVVTSAWFAQRDFSDVDILNKFREGLVIALLNDDGPKDHNLGLSLREMIHEFKSQTLVLFKALLLQPKMLFFGTRCERLCMIQFSLVSLIPGLINNLQDCADPSFDSYSKSVEKPTSLKTSDRSSLLAYMGLPLQIFGKGSMFGPYTPLQLLDLLADDGTKSYVVGSTNSLLLQQKDRYSDILINLDEDSIVINSPSLRAALALSAADRRWIDLLTQIVNDTWDEDHPSQPKTLGFMGSEEFIRLQFEEYLLALLSCMKYHEELYLCDTGESGHRSRAQLQNFNIEGDPAIDFNTEFLTQWKTTSNYALFSRLTSDALLFSITEPRHPNAGGLSMDDIQRRLSQQVADLHLDERVREGREALNRHISTGQKKVSAVFNNFWSDIETMREAQRKRTEERYISQSQSQRTSFDKEAPLSPTLSQNPADASWFAGRSRPSVDMTQAQASVSAASQKATSYLSSWGSWASEKRREWTDKRGTSASPNANSNTTTSPSSSVLNLATEFTDLDRGRRLSIQSKRSERNESKGSRTESPNGEGLTRSLSRRKRWSNILLRRESGEFQRRDDVSTSDSFDTPFPKSPLSQGLPAYTDDTELKRIQDSQEGKSSAQDTVDADGFSSVSLTPTEGLGLTMKPDESGFMTQNESTPKGVEVDSSLGDSMTALPAKETHPTQNKDSSGTN